MRNSSFQRLFRSTSQLSLVIVFLSVAFYSCQKEKINFTFLQLTSGTSNDLNSIFFINDSIGYVCGGSRYEKGDILKTDDGGITWKDQSTFEMTKALYKITFPFHDTGFACGYDGMIFRTFDGGEQWQYFQSQYYEPIHDVFMVSPDHGFSCGGNGYQSGYLLTTGDGGNSWTADTTETEYRSIYFFDDSTGVLAGYGAILRTTDGGKNWIYTDAQQDFFVSMNFVNDEVGYAAGYTGTILKTTDGGQSWERLRNPNLLYAEPLFFNQIIFQDQNTGYIIGENGCFLKTADGGNNWLQVSNAPDGDWNGIALLSGGGFICGKEGEIYRFLE